MVCCVHGRQRCHVWIHSPWTSRIRTRQIRRFLGFKPPHSTRYSLKAASLSASGGLYTVLPPAPSPLPPVRAVFLFAPCLYRMRGCIRTYRNKHERTRASRHLVFVCAMETESKEGVAPMGNCGQRRVKTAIRAYLFKKPPRFSGKHRNRCCLRSTICLGLDFFSSIKIT